MKNDRETPQATHFTAPVFLIGAIGGVALDILSLYILGFPTGPDKTIWWQLGVVIRAVLFMGLTGLLACLYSKGQLGNAFVIGIAAPSILLNISASVQKPKETLPTIQSIPVQGSKPGARLDGLPQGWGIFGPNIAEAQALPSSGEAKIGQLQVTMRLREGGALSASALKASTLRILDANGTTPLAVTVPPSQNFVFSFPPGKYVLLFDGPGLQSSATPVTLESEGTKEVTLQLQPKPTSAKNAWFEFLSGMGQRFEHVTAIKEKYAYGGRI